VKNHRHRIEIVVIMVEIIAMITIAYITYSKNAVQDVALQESKFIKYMEFNATSDALATAYKLDCESNGKDIHLNWIELMAYAATKGGGDFNKSSLKYITDVAARLNKGESMDEITKDMKHYPYYLESYQAVLAGLVGEYQKQNDAGEWEDCYGLKGYSPIAKGFGYSDYDDFGTSRSYGYRRPHLGHDMMGLIGTPVIAVESGYIEVLGWNQYGGWRIGLRSFDKKRYYYYAHLRQNKPFAENLKAGDVVTAGDVIGYMGHTGYSTKENTNNINETHLHFGLELVFDESQKESNNEIWIDCYALTIFLSRNRSAVVRNEETKEWTRAATIKDPAVDRYLEQIATGEIKYDPSTKDHDPSGEE
jgi:murein DD-endopeptidase MepM/ murein hydrolase activator NlpD